MHTKQCASHDRNSAKKTTNSHRDAEAARLADHDACREHPSKAMALRTAGPHRKARGSNDAGGVRKLFASQANTSICQRFDNVILLQRVRDDILLNKKLNFHLYQAVRKALFKPQAFFSWFFIAIVSG